MASVDVLLLGANGNLGRLIAVELARRGLSMALAGREATALEELAQSLTPHGVRSEVRPLDVTDDAALREAAAQARLVLSTIGPFTRPVERVVEASLRANVSYIDIANEWPAARQLLDYHERARDLGVALITGAGFGVAATETLVLRLVDGSSEPPARVRVAAAAAVAARSDSVARTIEEALTQGAITYRDGAVVREPLGTGATVLAFGGAERQVLPAPVGDLEAARLASDAPDVIAYASQPSPGGGDGLSYAWAELTWADGRVATAELQLGDGNDATAAIAAETSARLLASAVTGAWTPCRRFGAALVTDATDARVTVEAATA